MPPAHLRMNNTCRRILGLFGLGFSAYLACGLGWWLLRCSQNRYFQRRLYVSAALDLVSVLNCCGLVLTACAFLILITVVLARTARPWLARVLFKVEVVNRDRFRALITSVGLLVFLAGFAAIRGYDAAVASAAVTPPHPSDVLGGLLTLLLPAHSSRGLLLLVACGIFAALFVGGMSALLAVQRLRPAWKRVRAWIESPWFRTAGVCQLLFLLILNAWARWETKAAADDGPNVILISVDTLRADHLKSYGYPRATAFNIAKLAADGVVFSKAYAQAPWTNPSMASVQTGLYPYQHGVVGFQAKIAGDVTTLAEALQNNFYLTIGLVAHQFVGRAHGFARGFDVFDESQGQLAGPDSITSSTLTDAAVQYLELYRGRKFFLWLHYFDPHYSYVRHREYGYGDRYTGVLPAVLQLQHLNQVKSRLSAEDQQYILDVYDEEISYTDAAVGRLVRALQELKLSGRTVIVLTADHGEEFLERDRIGHGSRLYQELIHVPLIISGIAKTAYQRLDEPVETRSIGKTILNLCGSKVPFPGVDLLSPNTGSEDKNGNPAFSEGSYAWGKNGRREAVINFGRKLIHNLDDGSYELYDLNNDPLEKRNLFASGDEQARRISDYLVRELKAFRTRPSATPHPTALSEEEIKRLRSLGYIE